MTNLTSKTQALALKVEEIHEALLGSLTPGSPPGALELLRDLQTRVGNVEGGIEDFRKAQDGHEKRIANLEALSIVRWIENHKKLSILLSAVILMIVVDELRVPIALWVQSEWSRLALP